MGDLKDHPVPTLNELLTHLPPGPSAKKITFSNPDVQYLWGRTGFDHRFIGRMLGWFGQTVVLEALRVAVEDGIAQENVFVGMCRRLEAENGGLTHAES